MSGENEIKSMSEAVRIVIDRYPDGHRFHGNELKNDVVEIYPPAINMYVDTIQRKMRRWRRGQVRCVDNNKSLYEKVR
jgi:chorismate synthase